MKDLFEKFRAAVKEDFLLWRESVKDKRKVRDVIVKALVLCLVAVLSVGAVVLSLSGAIVDRVSARTSDHTSAEVFADAYGSEYDCILVLGCGVKEDGTPSDRLRDRVKVGVDLYHAGVAPKLLMSGDHGRENYDEVSAMLRLAVELGVPKEDVFLDHAGFSTYESIYRAKYIFSCSSLVVVTQEYHLYRALYLAEKFDMTARGVSADLVPYANMTYHHTRETLARCKDFFYALTKPAPTYLGDKIDLSGDGSTTHEAES
ncbi:MAG: YdcF family protein [Clostridia bacterium]|nr:YdcF family protein [Clostridia bacterium]